MVCHSVLKCATYQNTYLQNHTQHERTNEGSKKRKVPTFQHVKQRGLFFFRFFFPGGLYLHYNFVVALHLGDLSPLELELKNPTYTPEILTNWSQKRPYLLSRSHHFGWIQPLANSGMLIPWFYFGPISRGGGAVSSLFWTYTNLDEVFGKRSRIFVFSQKTDFPTKLKHHFSKKNVTAILQWTGSNLLVSFHFVLIGSCALNIPSEK